LNYISDFWQKKKAEINDCFDSLSIDTYRNWDPVSSVPLYEVWHWLGYMEGAQKTYDRIKYDKNLYEKWVKCMSPKTWGFTQTLYNNTLSRVKFPTYPELITTTYNLKSNHHIETYIQLTSKNILEYDRIVEFGGGAGDLSKLIFDMGYEGEYVMYDIPEVLRIQELTFLPSNKKPTFTTEIPKYSNNTLFISTWGFSEIPITLRNKFIDILQPENWLIVSQSNVFGVDNQLYFESWSGKRCEIPWVVWDGGSFYIVK